MKINHHETLVLNMKVETTGDYHVDFYPVTLQIITYVMTIHVGGHYGMNMFSTRILFLFMDQEFY